MDGAVLRDQELDIKRVPPPGDPDRKRVLNILAQRRYRRRKRDRLATLEAKATIQTLQTYPDVQSQPFSAQAALPTPATSDSPSGSHNGSISEANAEANTEANTDLLDQDFLAFGSVEFDDLLMADLQDDADFNFPLANGLSAADVLSMNDASSTASLLGSNSNGNNDTSLVLSAAQSSYSSVPEADEFVDDRTLDVPVLKIFNAAMQIAQLLDCEHLVWNPTSSRVLDRVTTLSIPEWLQPTEVQKQFAHHPLLDILPWPSVRTKLICIFSQRPELRPPSARDPLAILNMAYDMDDLSEGFRLIGANGLDGKNWEVGEAFFRNWWWSLDRDVVENSNRLRALRGASRLRLPET